MGMGLLDFLVAEAGDGETAIPDGRVEAFYRPGAELYDLVPSTAPVMPSTAPVMPSTAQVMPSTAPFFPSIA